MSLVTGVFNYLGLTDVVAPQQNTDQQSATVPTHKLGGYRAPSVGSALPPSSASEVINVALPVLQTTEQVLHNQERSQTSGLMTTETNIAYLAGGKEYASVDDIPEKDMPRLLSERQPEKSSFPYKALFGVVAALVIAGGGALLFRQFSGQLPSVALPNIPIFKS